MTINRFKLIMVILCGLLSISPVTVFAGADSGIYIGAGVGSATVKAKGTDPVNGDYSFNESDSAYKIFAGYNFGLIPLIDLAVEVSYVDFGKPTAATITGTPLKYELTGYNAYGLVGFSFGPFGLFAKAGAINWQSDFVIGSTSTDTSGTDAAYGVGVRFQLSSFAIRAEYELFEASAVNDLDLLSISAVFTF